MATEKEMKALMIINVNPGISAGDFAEKMWPGNPMHTKHSNGGDGCQVGKAAWLCGGSYLGKLIKKGWVRKPYLTLNEIGFRLTHDGIKTLIGGE